MSQKGGEGVKAKPHGSDKPYTKPKPFGAHKVGDGYKPHGSDKPYMKPKPFGAHKVGGKFGERPQRRAGVSEQPSAPRSKGIILPPPLLRQDPLSGRSGVLPSPNPKFDLPLWVDFGNYQPFLPTTEDEAKTWLLTVPPLEPTAFCRGVSAEVEVGHRGSVLTRGHWSSIRGLRQRGGKLFPRFAARLRRYRVRTWWGGQ